MGTKQYRTRITVRRHAQFDALGLMLESYGAEVQVALEWVAAELALQHDGYPTSVPGSAPPSTERRPVPCGYCEAESWRREGEMCGLARPCPDHDAPVDLTAVEAVADRRLWLERQRDQMADDITSLGLLLASYRRVAQATIGGRLSRPANDGHDERCNRGARRDGVHVWGDPLCERIADPTKAGMCDVCWEAERRWREDNDREARRRTGVADEWSAGSPWLCVRDGCVREATPGRADGLCSAHRMQDSRARRSSSQ